MDRRVFAEWLSENRIFTQLPIGRRQVLYVDNASGNAMTDEVKDALSASHTALRMLPHIATVLCQPADFFAIQKEKTAWRVSWDQ